MIWKTVDLKGVLDAFCQDSQACTTHPLGQGNINDTYLVEEAYSQFVIQRISRSVFPEPLGVIANFQKIATHLAEKAKGTTGHFCFASPVLTCGGELFYKDDRGEYWRGQSYIPHSSVRQIADKRHAYQVGFALAAFHSFVADLDIQLLHDPIPGFHNLDRYLEEFDHELDQSSSGTVDHALAYCIERIEIYRGISSIFTQAKKEGIVEPQAIHGDPKIDNFLFAESGEAFGLLDLDTVGAGLVHFDLGDCLRSCCNSGGEVGTGSVGFDIDICKTLLRGYFSWPGTSFSKEQYDLVFDAVLLISFELGLRFFTDHLRGNVYFKVSQDDENLVRAVRQFQLTDDIKRLEQEIRAITTPE